MRRLAIANLVGSLALALGACGGSQPAEPVEPAEDPEPVPAGPVSASGSDEARAEVRSAGGTLSLTNGARLEIPGGALEEPTEVVLAHGAEGQAFGDAETQRPLGPMLNVQPTLVAADGQAFEVSIPAQPVPAGFEESDLAFAMEEVHDQQRAIDTLGTRTRWQFYPVRVEDGRFVARITGLAGHRVQFGVSR
ncbi:MAG TPA: hypothetical protein RMH99_10250 [Sandaracinaceae bacterium LLY-WYZ-13_1]|nr:hypothetical protein [Sandaracinaceae bacterium LLY-WYZ-13_1]